LTDTATLPVEVPDEVLAVVETNLPSRPPRPPVLRGRPIGPLPIVGLCILLAHLPYLLGIFDPNPLLQQSALGLDIKRGLLPGGDTNDPNAGFTSQALAHRAILDWLHGKAPWWNPYEGVGSPLAGELQCAAFFPFIILLALANGQVYLYLVLCLIAGYSTYFLLQRLSLNPWACCAGAVAFGLNGTFAWFRYAPSNPVCFLPLMLLGIELVRQAAQERRRGPWWIIGLGFGLSILGGFPETAYLDGLLAGVWALVRLRGLARVAARRFLAATAAGAAMGIALAAPVLVAFVDYLPSASLAGNSGNITHSYITGRGASTLLFPYAFGSLWGFTSGSGGQIVDQMWGRTGGYLTVALILFAAVGLIGREHRALKLALVAWILLLVGRSYGVAVVSDLLELIPGMSHVITYRFMNPSLSMAVVVLAAFGVRDLLERRTPRSHLLVASATVTVLAVAAAVNAFDVDQAVRGVSTWEYVSFAWGFATILVITTLTVSPRLRRLAMVVVVAFLPVEAVVMFVIPELSAPRSGNVDLAVVSFLKSHIGLDRFATLGPFAPNYGSYFGIASINENDLPLPKGFAKLVSTKLDPNANPVFFTGVTSNDPARLSPEDAFDRQAATYAALGVKYLLVPPDDPTPDPRGVTLTAVYADPLATVYRLSRVAPYFQDRTAGCTVERWTEQTATVDCAQPSTLVRNELEIPGWTARVNGHTRPLGSTRLFQQSLSLPAGRSTVSYRYEPAHVGLAAGAGVAGVVAFPVSGMIRRRWWRWRGNETLV
jgi:hypothetical protein